MTEKTKATHSPGEWEAIGADAPFDDLWVRNIDGSICSLPMGTIVQSREEKIANAQLIAAAPEMLEALEAIRATFDVPQHRPACVRAHCKLYAAIASAKREA